MSTTEEPELLEEQEQNKPQISLDVFRKLLVNITQEDLMRLPLEKLPDDIPKSLMTEVRPEIRPALETILMERNSVATKTRQVIGDSLGDAALKALDLSKEVGNQANLRVLSFKLAEIDEMIDRIAEKPSIESDQLLSKFIGTTDRMLPDLLKEQLDTQKGVRALTQDANLPEDLQDTVDIAADKLSRQSRQISNLMSKYYGERVTISQQVMQRRLNAIEAQEAAQLLMHREVEKSHQELVKALKQKNKLFGKKKFSEEEIQELKNRVKSLIEDYQTSLVPIGYEELLMWHDSVVEASLHQKAKQRVQMKIHMGRKDLMRLLHEFCEICEHQATFLAENPFLSSDALAELKSVLQQEAKALNYFIEKTSDDTVQLTMAAQMKREALDKISKEIISSYKDHKHLAEK